ncbi:MAG: LptA/OstA family protein [Sphingomonas sp.]|uniref:LptA/OstA family protein n=1 Tax=Sphingomonas sp. TaxID=28214 RepID=UPI003F7F8D35
MAHRATTFILLACTATALLGARASAVQSGGNETLSVDADHIEIQDKTQRALFTGSVRARQGTMTVTSDRAEVLYSASIVDAGGSPPEISQIRASGNVVVTRPDENASGSYAIYDLNKRTITMIGNVVLHRGVNVVRGGRLVINLNSNAASLDAGGSKLGTSKTGGRVTGVFSVPKRTAPTTSATPAPSDNK